MHMQEPWFLTMSTKFSYCYKQHLVVVLDRLRMRLITTNYQAINYVF